MIIIINFFGKQLQFSRTIRELVFSQIVISEEHV